MDSSQMPTARGREIASTGCRHHPDASPQTERYRKRRCPTADSKAHAIDTAFGHGRPPVCFLSRQLESSRGEPGPPFHLDAILLSKCARNCTLPLFARMAVYCTHGELALHANSSRADAAERERIANGRGWARRAENYALKYTKAPPSLRRATSPFSKSALSLFWAVLFEIPENIAITSPTSSSVPVDSKHFKTSFSLYLMCCSSQEESEAVSWCGSTGRIRSVSDGPWDSLIVGGALKKSLHTDQIISIPLPVLSVAPIKLMIRINVGFLVSETPPAIATSLSTNMFPELLTRRQSSPTKTRTYASFP